MKRKKDTLQAAQTRARRLAKKLAAEEAACARMREAKDAEIARLKKILAGTDPASVEAANAGYKRVDLIMGLPHLAPGDFVHSDTKRAEEAERELRAMKTLNEHAGCNIHSALDKMNEAFGAMLAALRNVG